MTVAIDGLVAHLGEADARDQARWQTSDTEVWPSPRVFNSRAEAVDHLREWAPPRAAWLDQNPPGEGTR